MKKAIAALMLCSAMFLCGYTGARVQKSVEFKGETYLRNLPDGKPQNFTPRKMCIGQKIRL